MITDILICLSFNLCLEDTTIKQKPKPKIEISDENYHVENSAKEPPKSETFDQVLNKLGEQEKLSKRKKK